MATNCRRYCCPRLFQLLLLVLTTTCFSATACVARSIAFIGSANSRRVVIINSRIGSALHLSNNNIAANKGFGKSDTTSSNTNNNRKKGKSQEKRNKKFFTEDVFLTSTPKNDKDEPLLNRFGLPIPTEHDLFPPMPAGTELIPADDEQITQQHQMDDLLSKHAMTLNMSFLEKMSNNTNSGDNPMKLRILHQSPPVLAIDNFLTNEECQYCLDLVVPSDNCNKEDDDVVQVRSATFSSSYVAAQSKRTSTTWYVTYRSVPTLLAKITNLFDTASLDQCEEPQIVRYRNGEEFSWHYDEVPASQLSNGGQRIATVLVYLNNVTNGGGGGTVFRDLVGGKQQQQLSMTPKQGSLLLFFPAFADGVPDDRTLHKGEKVEMDNTKMIVQMWIHERPYVPVLPKGNSHDDARKAIQEKEVELGLISDLLY